MKKKSTKRTDVDWAKIGKRSQAKGIRFERKIQNAFREKFGDKIYRTPRSGAFIFKGDIQGLPGFYIECKSEKLPNSLPRTMKQVETWLEQAISKAEGEQILIIFKSGSILALSTQVFKGLVPCCFVAYKNQKLPIYLFREVVEMLKSSSKLNIAN